MSIFSRFSLVRLRFRQIEMYETGAHNISFDDKILVAVISGLGLEDLHIYLAPSVNFLTPGRRRYVKSYTRERSYA